jgi:DegV family protein with EDD domain
VSAQQVRIVTDSSCDLPQAVVDELGITVVPLTIRIAGEEFVDRVELTAKEFWAKCAASPTLPETAAPSPGQFEAEYRRLAAEGATGIAVVDLSSALSATMQSAELAARAVVGEIDVRVVDSRTVSLALGLIVAAVARRAAAGASLDEVESAARQLIERTKLWGALDTLENLKKGGRIGGAKALLAGVLSIKPIVEVRGGRVEEGGKQRTRSKALSFLVDKMASYGPLEQVAVLQADCDDVDRFVAMLRSHFDGEIVVGDIGPVVGSHAGKGTIGVAFTVK